MNLNYSLKWMFVGSIIIGLYLNGMNILAYRFNDLYFSSKTLIYSGLLMASNMCILEVFMSYNHSGKFDVNALLLFVSMSVILVLMLRNQFLVSDNDWLKRMISHHSTALTTSHNIVKITKNKKLKKLAKDIIDTQEKEIALMISMI